MTIWRGRPERQASGARYWPMRKKRLSELGKDPSPTIVGRADIKKKFRARGGNLYTALVKVAYANVADSGKMRKVKILDVSANRANRHFVRQDVITKGAIIKTESGEAKVTSRPTRDGVVNAVLIKK